MAIVLNCRETIVIRKELQVMRSEEKQCPDENQTEYRCWLFGFVGRHLVLAGDQSAYWHFHDWTDSVDVLWQYRRGSGHRFIAGR